MRRFKHKDLVFLIILLLGCAIISLSIGNIPLDINKVLAFDDQTWNVLIQSRIPRTMAVILCGVGLSMSGLVMQKLMKNRFVSPSTAATQDGARLGIMLSLLLFSQMGVLMRSLFSFLFALITTVVFMLLVERIRIKNTLLVPLIGLMLGSVIDSITTFLAVRFDVSQVLASYMTASFSLTIKGSYEILYLLIPAIIALLFYSTRFSIVSLGEDISTSVGINYRKTVYIGLILVALMDGIIVASFGTIGFIGLIVPNMISLWKGDHLSNTLVLTGLVGAIFLLAVDIFSRLIIFPYELLISLPIGVIGSVIFLYFIARSNHEKAKS